MFNRSRRNLARWFTLSMGSILMVFTGAIYFQRAVERLETIDRLLYKQARVMAANVEYSQGRIDLSHVPILGDYSPPPDSEIVYVRWYDANSNLRQFFGAEPIDRLQSNARFETLRSGWLRQLTLPVEQNNQTIGYLQIAIPLTETQTALREFLLLLAIAVPFTLGLISLVGWWLGGLAMQPIRLAYQQLERFTSDASHELRAPLAAILSNAQFGLMAEIDRGQAKHTRLEKIADIAKSMNLLVGNLLFLARQAGQLTPNFFQPVCLNELLKEAIATPAIQTASQHLKLHLELPEDAIVVQGNPELLMQAIANLLTNACKYTPAEGTVWLRLIAQYHRILIEVEDTGIGIPQVDLPHIFNRFYRVDQERSRQKGGFGLGLAIVQQITAAHNGRLNVWSQIDRGSVFQIELPLL